MKTTAIDEEISSYLPHLSVKQKKAVLTVVKTFAEEHDAYSEEFKSELDKRYEEYINGGELVSEEDANKRVQNIINGKSK